MKTVGKWMSRCLASASVILWYAVIFGFSAQDGERSGSLSGTIAKAVVRLFGGDPEGKTRETLETVIRKCAHMTEFAILALLLLWAVCVWTEVRNIKAYATALLITVCLAALDEFHQTFVPDRAGRPLDVLIDSCGALAALGAVWIITHGKSSSESSESIT